MQPAMLHPQGDDFVFLRQAGGDQLVDLGRDALQVLRRGILDPGGLGERIS